MENDNAAIGVVLVRAFSEASLGYELQQFMIARRYQGKGYGSAALPLVLGELRKERHFDPVEVYVKRENGKSVRL